MTSPGGTDYEIDDGMASERTDLAWGRSGLALVACGAVVFRDVPWLGGDRTRRIAGLAVLALGVATWLLGAWQARRRRAPGLARAVARPVDLLPVALGVIAVGVAAFVVALVLPART
ncbi:MAG: DUF202 domain-containing protein [Acidimicrobiales bacterium]